jgi:cell wall-associated NlpC family hydrolase
VTGRVLATVIGALVGVVMAFTLAVTALLGAAAGACTLPGIAPPTSTGASAAPLTGFDAVQVANATAIIRAGADLGVPVRGWIIAVAAAIQESGLRVTDHGDSAGPDSRGLFQQRTPWGPLTERMDTGSARLFYTGGHAGQPGLLDIPDWQALPLTLAAHHVQHGQDVTAYTAREPAATALVLTIAGSGLPRAAAGDPQQSPSTAADCPGDAGDGLPAGTRQALPAGFTPPAGTPAAQVTAVTWALAQRGTPYSYGGDCTAAHSGDPAHQCDCSSLVQMAYHAAGVSLPRTTRQQVHAGTAVPDVSQVRAGDLVFIPGSHGTPTTPGHVGLYVGDGLLVNAPHTGAVISLAPIDSWAPISAIRRIVNR